jgi:hypothetical protein
MQVCSFGAPPSASCFSEVHFLSAPSTEELACWRTLTHALFVQGPNLTGDAELENAWDVARWVEDEDAAPLLQGPEPLAATHSEHTVEPGGLLGQQPPQQWAAVGHGQDGPSSAPPTYGWQAFAGRPSGQGGADFSSRGLTTFAPSGSGGSSQPASHASHPAVAAAAAVAALQSEHQAGAGPHLQSGFARPAASPQQDMLPSPGASMDVHLQHPQPQMERAPSQFDEESILPDVRELSFMGRELSFAPRFLGGGTGSGFGQGSGPQAMGPIPEGGLQPQVRFGAEQEHVRCPSVESRDGHAVLLGSRFPILQGSGPLLTFQSSMGANGAGARAGPDPWGRSHTFGGRPSEGLNQGDPSSAPSWASPEHAHSAPVHQGAAMALAPTLGGPVRCRAWVVLLSTAHVLSYSAHTGRALGHSTSLLQLAPLHACSAPGGNHEPGRPVGRSATAEGAWQ